MLDYVGVINFLLLIIIKTTGQILPLTGPTVKVYYKNTRKYESNVEIVNI